MTHISTSSFPNHGGGVIQVAHSGRWGAVPESLLEDGRLSLDARAIAAWLSIKSSGWQICISALRKANGEGNKPLGEHKWLRIARELEVAGYFSRQRKQGDNGQWLWYITFLPIPGLPGDGSSMHGAAKSGKPRYIPRQTKPSPSKPSLQQPPAISVAELKEPSSSSGDELVFPHGITQEEKNAIARLIQHIAISTKQELMDELAGAIRANTIKKGNVQFVRGLVNAFQQGQFTPSLGLMVLSARNTATKNQAAEKIQAQLRFKTDHEACKKGEKILAGVRMKISKEVQMRK